MGRDLDDVMSCTSSPMNSPDASSTARFPELVGRAEAAMREALAPYVGPRRALLRLPAAGSSAARRSV